MPQQLQLLMVMSLSNSPSECPIVRLSRQFASRPTQSHQRTTNNVKLSLYNFSRGKPGGGKCRGRQLRRLPWRPKLSAVCEQLETYESCLPNNNKINCARRGEKVYCWGWNFPGGVEKGVPPCQLSFRTRSCFCCLQLDFVLAELLRFYCHCLPAAACYTYYLYYTRRGGRCSKVFPSAPYDALWSAHSGLSICVLSLQFVLLLKITEVEASKRKLHSRPTRDTDSVSEKGKKAKGFSPHGIINCSHTYIW